MSIRRDEGTGIWQIDIAKKGLRRVQRSADTKRREEAQELHDRILGDLWREKHLGQAPVPTWDDATIEWLAAAERRGKRSIVDDIHKFDWLLPRLKGKRLNELTQELVEGVLRAKENEGCSGATANRYAALIAAVMRRCKVAPPKIERRPERDDTGLWITREQARRLVEELPAHLAAMVRFSLATGLRQHNVTHLEWGRVDLPRAIAWVDASDAKGKRTLRVQLNPDAVRVIEEQAGKHPQYVFVYQPVTPNGKPARGPRPITQPNGQAWEKAKKRAGIDPDFRWHDLRHTWATWHVQGGTPLEVLQRLGGWRDYRMVLRYAKFAPDHLAKYADNAGLSIAAEKAGPITSAPAQVVRAA